MHSTSGWAAPAWCGLGLTPLWRPAVCSRRRCSAWVAFVRTETRRLQQLRPSRRRPRNSKLMSWKCQPRASIDSKCLRWASTTAVTSWTPFLWTAADYSLLIESYRRGYLQSWHRSSVTLTTSSRQPSMSFSEFVIALSGVLNSWDALVNMIFWHRMLLFASSSLTMSVVSTKTCMKQGLSSHSTFIDLILKMRSTAASSLLLSVNALSDEWQTILTLSWCTISLPLILCWWRLSSFFRFIEIELPTSSSLCSKLISIDSNKLSCLWIPRIWLLNCSLLKTVWNLFAVKPEWMMTPFGNMVSSFLVSLTSFSFFKIAAHKLF